MTGANLERLKAAMHVADSGALLTSYLAWRAGHEALNNVSATLEKVAPEVLKGFSDGLDPGEDGVAQVGSAAFTTLKTTVVDPRKVEMNEAANKLETAQTALYAAEREARAEQEGRPAAVDPGPAPEEPDPTGMTDDEYKTARQDYASAARWYGPGAAAFEARDERARKLLEDVDAAYAAAIPVLKKIHGEPVYPEDIPPPGETGPGGLPASHRRPISRPEGLPIPTAPGGTGGPGGPGGIGGPVISTPHPYLPTPIDFTDPGQPGSGSTGPGGTSGGPGINPALGGGIAAAGLFGGPGLVNGIRAALARGPLGTAPGTIGATTRAGGSATLGRGGAVTPGSQVNRAAGGRGAGGRGSGGRGVGGRGAGVPGSQGGRGGGGRGGIGAGGGRGRKNRDGENGTDRDLFDDGSDWLDDEGTGPGVLG